MAQATVVKIPPRLFERAQVYVKEGWFADVDSLVIEALRRYLETHQGDLLDQFIREDVEWGLKGDE
jgi:Arc/MetJ-type ribon-helix-helix transcriptional regulator